MKCWNIPEVSELDIKMTMNGRKYDYAECSPAEDTPCPNTHIAALEGKPRDFCQYGVGVNES